MLVPYLWGHNSESCSLYFSRSLTAASLAQNLHRSIGSVNIQQVPLAWSKHMLCALSSEYGQVWLFISTATETVEQDHHQGPLHCPLTKTVTFFLLDFQPPNPGNHESVLYPYPFVISRNIMEIENSAMAWKSVPQRSICKT
jgi:hypothetical protein